MRTLGAFLGLAALIGVGFGVQRILYGRRSVVFTDVLSLIGEALSSIV